MENLPLPPFKYDELKSNITFGKLQQMSFEDVSNWVDEMRVELLEKWDSGIPPSIGMDKDTIIKRFKKLIMNVMRIMRQQNGCTTYVLM